MNAHMTPTCQHCGNWRRRNAIFGTCYQAAPVTTAERETCEHYSDKIANRAEVSPYLRPDVSTHPCLVCKWRACDCGSLAACLSCSLCSEKRAATFSEEAQ